MIVEEALSTGENAANKDFPLIQVFIIFTFFRELKHFYAFHVALLRYDFDAFTMPKRPMSSGELKRQKREFGEFKFSTMLQHKPEWGNF